MSIRGFVLVLVTALSIFAFPFSTLAKSTEVRLALNWKPEPQFGGFYAAHFTKEEVKKGMDLTVLEGGSGTPTVQMLANGQVDFAIVSAEEILISNDRNPKNKIVALLAVYQTNPQMIMCHAEKDLHSLKDVYSANVTLSIQSGLTYAQYLKNKFPYSKAKVVPYLGGIGNFITDKNFCQQGFITSEPLAAEKAGQKVSSFLVADEGFNPYTTVLAVREDTLKKNKSLVESMTKAARAGWEEYLKSPSSTNQKMHSLNPAMDMDTFAKSAAAQTNLIQSIDTNKNGIGSMKTERWQELATQLRDLKVIDKIPDVKDVFRNF